MIDFRTVNVTADICCIIFLTVVAVYMGVQKHREDGTKKYFMMMVFSNMGMLMGDIPNWICEGYAHGFNPVLLRIGCLIQYLCGLTVPLLFGLYICKYLRCSKKEIRMLMIPTGIICTIGLTLDLLNLVYGYYYYIDGNNVYHRAEHWIFSQITVVFGVILYFCLIIYKRKEMRTGVFWSSIFYILAPVIAILIQSNRYGISCTYLATTVALYIIFFNMESDKDEEMERQKAELAEGKLAILLSQIRPHFLYNALGTIRALCSKNPDQAVTAIDSFARYLRGNMDFLDEQGCIPFQDELNLVENYLHIEKLRYGKYLQVRYDVQVKEFMCPSLMLQTLTENAVRHGLSSQKQGGTIDICSREEEAAYVIQVKDDGKGFELEKLSDQKDRHIGIENTKKRLKHLCKGWMQIESTPEEGTNVTIWIPK